MKTLLALVVVLPMNVWAQFSGKVTYQDSYVSKNPTISSSEFEKFIGTKRELYIQGPFYKVVHYGDVKSGMLYRGDV
jgi:hypothetical protein